MGSEPRPRLLLVDDEDVILDVLGAVFRRGFEVATAKDMAGARAALAEGIFHAAVIDKNLPDGFGVQLIREAREKHPFTQFIVMTGYASFESAVDALEAGAYDYLTKPFADLKAILAKVERAVEKSQLQRKNAALIGELEEKNRLLTQSLDEVRRLRALVADDAELAGAREGLREAARQLRSGLAGVAARLDSRLGPDDLPAIQRDATRLLEAVDELDELSRPSRGRLAGEDMGALTRTALATIGNVAAERRVHVNLRVEGSCPVEVDVARVELAIRHLLRRAIESSPSGGEVYVAVRGDAERGELSIEDEGIGIADDAWKLHLGPSVPGALRSGGAGLRLCRAIVEEHGGTVVIAPRTPSGLRVVVTLPIHLRAPTW